MELKKQQEHPKTLSCDEVILLKDGKDYINVYSAGNTLLGQNLSNFARTPFSWNNKMYESVEGWWYSTLTGKDFSSLYGFKAKQLGRQHLKIRDGITREELLAVLQAKLAWNSMLVEQLVLNPLPFSHHYVVHNWNQKGEADGEYKMSADPYLWTADLWREITNMLVYG